MSGSLLEIKKKITGVKNTRKITKAMQLVAASKMRQFQKKALASRSYVRDLLTVLDLSLGEGQHSIYEAERKDGKILFVLYTSDKGLCGALNTKLIKALFNSELWQQTPEEKRVLYTIGRKSFEFARNNKIPVAKHFVGIPEKLDTLNMLKIVDKITEFWREENCEHVYFVAPHYKNSFTFYPVRKTYLPFSHDMLKQHMEATETVAREEWTENQKMNLVEYMLFDPNRKVVVERLHELIIQALFIQAFMELKAAEYSSRMIAMQNATDSADKITKQLTLNYNKARQAAITQEIAELSGASAAL